MKYLDKLQYVDLNLQELANVTGGGSDAFWYGVGKHLGQFWAGAGDAGYFRAHKYGGKTRY